MYQIYGRSKSECTLDEIADYARALIAETRLNPPPEDATFDLGYWASFWPYVKGDAFAYVNLPRILTIRIKIHTVYHLRVLGWCCMQSAFEAEDDETSMKYFAEAAEQYTTAAGMFMEDDENYAYFLKIAIEAYWWLNSPLKVTLPMVKHIRERLPGINKIWEYSTFSEELSTTLQQAFVFEKEYRKRILEGAITLDSSARPDDMVSDYDF